MPFTAQLGTSDSRLGNIVLGYGSSVEQTFSAACEAVVGAITQPELYVRTTQLTALVIQGDADPHARTTQITALVIYRPSSFNAICPAVLGAYTELGPVEVSSTCQMGLTGTVALLNPFGSFSDCRIALSCEVDSTGMILAHQLSATCEAVLGAKTDVTVFQANCEAVLGAFVALRTGSIATPCLAGDGDTIVDENYVF